MDPVAARLVAPLHASVADRPAIGLGQPKVGSQVAVHEVVVVGAQDVDAHDEEASGSQPGSVVDVDDEPGLVGPVDRSQGQPRGGDGGGRPLERGHRMFSCAGNGFRKSVSRVRSSKPMAR